MQPGSRPLEGVTTGSASRPEPLLWGHIWFSQDYLLCTQAKYLNKSQALPGWQQKGLQGLALPCKRSQARVSLLSLRFVASFISRRDLF